MNCFLTVRSFQQWPPRPLNQQWRRARKLVKCQTRDKNKWVANYYYTKAIDFAFLLISTFPSTTVKRTGLDQPVGPVGLGTGLRSGSKINLNRLGKRTGKNQSNPVGPADSVNPANPRLDQVFPGCFKNQFFFSGRDFLHKATKVSSPSFSLLWQVAAAKCNPSSLSSPLNVPQQSFSIVAVAGCRSVS